MEESSELGGRGGGCEMSVYVVGGWLSGALRGVWE